MSWWRFAILPLVLVIVVLPASAAGADQVYLPSVLNGFSVPLPVVNPATHVLSAEALEKLASASTDLSTLAFSERTAELASLSPGTILVAGPSRAAPHGFLRRVLSMEQAGKQFVLHTAPAALDEAIAAGDLHFAQALLPSQVLTSFSRPGVKLGAAGASFTVGLSGVVLYDGDGNPATNDDQVRADGNLSFSPVVEMEIEIRMGLVRRFSFQCQAEVNGQLELEGDVAATALASEQVLASYSFEPVVVFLGQVPVVIEPILELKVGLEGSVDVALRGKIETMAQVSAGVAFEKGSWQTWREVACTPEGLESAAAAALDAKAYAGAVASVAIYGVISPSMELDSYLKLRAAVTSEDGGAQLWYGLYGGLRGITGVRVAVLGHELVDYRAVVFDWSKLLMEGSGVATPPVYGAIAAGELHTCAIGRDGAGWCWGRNAFGQIGDGTLADRLRPAMVAGLGQGAAATAAGDAHTCALKAGMLYCWGANTCGQLGNGRSGYAEYSSVPVVVQGLPGETSVASIAAGVGHTCAARTDGAVWCWGAGDRGQLGHGSMISSPYPVPVSGLSNVVALTAGLRHTCALTQDGEVWCWGSNSSGQLGNGGNVDSALPVQVVGLGGRARSFSAGAEHTCAVLADGAVRCWGWNKFGQLGDGSTNSSNVPVSVRNLADVVSVSAGYNHACALKTDGTIWCWGDNFSGQLGNGRSGSGEWSPAPVAVRGLGGTAVALEAGGHHTCALVQESQGTVAKCWGWNAFGQLGNGSTTSSSTPVLVR